MLRKFLFFPAFPITSSVLTTAASLSTLLMAGQQNDGQSAQSQSGIAVSPTGLEFASFLPSSSPPPCQRPPEDTPARFRSSSRVERTTTSCGECRRRKQKCDQGRPCGNCAKRFPLPVCEYKQAKSQNIPASVPRGPTLQPILPSQNHALWTLGGLQSSVLPTSYPLMHSHLAPPLLPQTAPFTVPDTMLVGQPQSSDGSSWVEPPYGAADTMPAILLGDSIGSSSPGDGYLYLGGSVGSCPYFDMPAAGLHDGWFLSGEYFADAATPSDLLLASSSNGGSNIGGSTSDVHEQVRNDAFYLLDVRNQTPDQLLSCTDTQNGTDTLCSWLRILTWTAPAEGRIRHPLVASSSEPIHLPPAVTRPSSGSVQTYVKLISRFTFCLDSQPAMGSSFADVSAFTPGCLHMPLLRHVALYTSARFLDEAKHIDHMVAAAHISRSIAMLSARLQRRTTAAATPSDSAVLVAVQLVMNEWYRGDDACLSQRLSGLHEMLRMRGTSKQLGTNGLISKLAIAVIYLSGIHRSDLAVATSFDMSHHLQAVRFQSSGAPASFRVAHNTPLVAQLVSFDQCAEALGMHPAVASILDDVRFLVEAVLDLPLDPSANGLQKIRTTAQWIRNRLQRLSASLEPDPADSSVSAAFANTSPPQEIQPRPKPDAPVSRAETGTGSVSAEPDALYRAVRQVALIYCDAILERRPFRAVVSPEAFQRLWTAAWRVSVVAAWRGVLGVFMWITLAVVASAPSDRAEDAFVRAMLSVCTVQMSLESWDMAVRALQAALRLDAWLQGGEGSG